MLSRLRRPIAAVAMFLSAIALQRAATAPWSVARASDGRLYRVSAIGISFVVAPNDARVPTTDCRWWPKVGNASICAVAADGEAAYERMRLAYPALQVAMWLSVASIFGLALRIPKNRLGEAVPAAVVLGLLLWTIATMQAAPARAFVTLRDATVTQSALGTWLGCLVAALAGGSVLVLLFSQRSDEKSAPSVQRVSLLTVGIIAASATSLPAQRPAIAAPNERALSDPDSLKADAAAFASLPTPLRRVLDVRSRVHPVTPDPNLTCVALSATSDGSRRQRVQGRLGDGTNLVVFARTSPTKGLARVEFVRRLASGEQRSFTWDAEGDLTTAAEWAAGATNATTYPVPRGGPIPRAVRGLGRLVARWRCPPP